MADVPEGSQLVFSSDAMLPIVVCRNVYLLPGIPRLFERKLEALYNTPGPGVSLADHLLSQVRLTELSDQLFRAVEHVIFSLDEDGKLEESADWFEEARAIRGRVLGEHREAGQQIAQHHGEAAEGAFGRRAQMRHGAGIGAAFAIGSFLEPRAAGSVSHDHERAPECAERLERHVLARVGRRPRLQRDQRVHGGAQTVVAGAVRGRVEVGYTEVREPGE